MTRALILNSSLTEGRARLAPALELAAQHITAFGDTDIFPSPIVFSALGGQVALLRVAAQRLHDTLPACLDRHAPQVIRLHAPTGSKGLRLASQLDPVWSVYFQALSLAIAPEIERARVPISEHVIFSYRLADKNEKNNLFDPTVNWSAFDQRVKQFCGSHAFAVSVDIADFYSRIRLDGLRNALNGLNTDPVLLHNLKQTVEALGVETYGLPVGGSGSRILAELALVEFDSELHARQVPFCRFVDDIRLFAEDERGALGLLQLVSDRLAVSGFTLQKAKTSVIPTRELAAQIALARVVQLPPERSAEAANLPLDNFLTLRDPYSELTVDSALVMDELAKSEDFVRVLECELLKDRPSLHAIRLIIASLAFLPDQKRCTVIALCLKKLDPILLAQVFSQLSRKLLRFDEDLGKETRSMLRSELSRMIKVRSPVFSLDLNFVFALRLLDWLSPIDDDVALQLRLLCAEKLSPFVRANLVYVVAGLGAWEDGLSSIEETCVSRLERQALALARCRSGEDRRSALAGLDPDDPSDWLVMSAGSAV